MKYAIPLLLLSIVGCARPQIPNYPAMSYDDARPILRGHMPETLTVQGQLTLSEPKQSIQLDAAMVIRQPSEMRLRAWKFGQAVFDLTVRPDGVYAYSGRKEVDPESLKRIAGSITSWLQLLAPLSPDAIPKETTQDEWVFERQIAEARVLTHVDRRTLVVTRHEMFDGQARRASIELSKYVLRGSVPWPGQIVVSEGKRQIKLNTSSLRTDVAPKAFEPPRRAERLTP
jgi:hypothetical protein